MEWVYEQPLNLLFVKFLEEHLVVLLIVAEVIADFRVEFKLALPFWKAGIAFNELIVHLADRGLSRVEEVGLECGE